MLIWYDLVWNNNLGYVRLNGSYNILKSINFQVAGIPSLCKEKNMNMKSMSYTGKVLWTVWELDVEDYEILLFPMTTNSCLNKAKYDNWQQKQLQCTNRALLVCLSRIMTWIVYQLCFWKKLLPVVNYCQAPNQTS